MALTITAVPGVRVGHWTNLEGGTGCTVVLCETAVSAGVDVRGAAPATRETDVLRPGGLVGRVHAVLLSGGSAFGLDAATGVMRFLEERGIGVETQAGPVPIVGAACLFDLGVGRRDTRPDAKAGYAACSAAGVTPQEGCVGAGTGATVAKLGGLRGAVKAGIGTAAREIETGAVIGALVAVNALGSVFDPWTGQTLAQPRTERRVASPLIGENTTIGVLATNARLDTAGANRLATLGHDGLAMALRPAHTQYDGDTLFAVSVPGPRAVEADPVDLGAAAAQVVAEAILRAVRAATSLHGIPAAAA
jgi:L-aminopeptidase/D-esterase-like protein